MKYDMQYDNDWNTTIYNNMAEFHKYSVEEKKPDTNVYILDDSNHIMY